MQPNLYIRHEKPTDYRAVEALHREAFWNLNVPGCNEHHLAHVLRSHPDFIPELDYVCELDGKIIANVMYTKSRLLNDNGGVTQILTFGPVGVLPEYQRRGVGKALLEKSFERAAQMGWPAIVIFGSPGNYVARGFKSCMKYNVCLQGGVFPTALLVRELQPGFFDGQRYRYEESDAYALDPRQTAAFDAQFPPKQPGYQPSQEDFYIHCRSILRKD